MSYDLIVFGASGFTGRLVADYLNRRYGVGGELAWAMAGRNAAKLAELRAQIGAPATLPLLVADAADPQALRALVAQAKVVITTVGPYQRHGEALVRACAEAGTDYVDLCGEPGWMATMIPQLQGPAERSGARIVFSCGFDSIPFDLGVLFLQDEALRRYGQPLMRVAGRVVALKGGALSGMSGGTIASALASYEAMGRDPEQARLMADPFALTAVMPGFRGPAQPDGEHAAFDEHAQAWSGPFVMAAINTKNVHRTNALRGLPWGKNFCYDERLLTGRGRQGERRARGLARLAWLQDRLLGFAPTRALLRRFVLPKPGEGPSQAQREKGRYEIVFYGQTADGRRLAARVKGQGDPGYGSTCKLISEAALCLLQDISREMTAGGVWTPGAAMGMALVRRLQERADLGFAIEE
ncbi:saccharopine dehydrogenase family protein [Paucibacter soli]|uniref:saccharopine dehydrogenase family protein n=1 Tax=Paucibacter soli TaxID=3133433 RepID=UPI00309949AD